jgi:glycoprotein-N-acetylgalactosamine 3-beta-galactosyltransferase
LKCDDDTFLNYKHLEKFLIDKNYSRAVSYGRLVGDNENRNSLDENQTGFLSGGAGYVMSNEAFGRLAKRLDLNYSYCPYSGAEDCDVSECLRRLGSVIGVSFDDQAKCRFHSNHLFTVYPSQEVKYIFSFRYLYKFILISQKI